MSDTVSPALIDDFTAYFRDKNIPSVDVLAVSMYLLVTSFNQILVTLTQDQMSDYIAQVTSALGTNMSLAIKEALADQCQSPSTKH